MTEDNVTRITAVFLECRTALERYFASHLHCSMAEAKELAQDTYLALLRREERTDVQSWEPLLWCSAHNRLATQLKQRRFRRDQDALIYCELDAEDRRTPEALLSQEQTAVALARAIASLPHPFGYVVTCFWQDHPHHQIAQALGITERTSRRYLARAIDELKQQLGRDHVYEQR